MWVRADVNSFDSGDVHQGKAHNIENKMNDRRPLKECEDGEVSVTGM